MSTGFQFDPQALLVRQKQPVVQHFRVLEGPYEVTVLDDLYRHCATVWGHGGDVVWHSVLEGSIAEVEMADVEEDAFP